MNLKAQDASIFPNIVDVPQPHQLLNRIICGDALDVMTRMPSGSVDLVITSPPYNLRNSTGNGLKDGRGGKWENAALKHGYTHHDDRMPHAEYVAWQRRCLAEMMRVSNGEEPGPRIGIQSGPLSGVGSGLSR